MIPPEVGDPVDFLYGSEVCFPSLEDFKKAGSKVGDDRGRSFLLYRGSLTMVLEIVDVSSPLGTAARVGLAPSGEAWTFLPHLQRRTP